MPPPMSWPITSATDTGVSVQAASTLVLAANVHRADAVIVNDSDTVIYLARGNAAALNAGIRLNASGGSYEINLDNLFLGAIYAICSVADKVLTVSEGVN